ncbi:UbiH/UbiF/VisC/COQ6 family ubiquinone biosynthesis hydroxylase [Neptunomonas qingdaonensis]|uniref:2-octaprenyl-3-methyl-6-methoxy-1,4-benzoquinol hydroxylase n=1 Tax=Neptunomonas qingdaonensis TaxID=1045558 RepID=A0A1I2R1C1_9GAMM|nr:UbiH/UbiF/VisC/COQ6 family ubiquinone biosynthesis hydroxylase [Neptunomonas qingdaonensis]SFG31721.1 2-octaprenyl-3-methyl-6-methoxy-1,4-benzoquinol hydroxylase [Neptunomonas qingdaonensis]
MQSCYDVVIVGGGMVGGALACALGNTSLKVAVIETQLPAAFDVTQDHDLRVSALSIASENILKSVGSWQGIIDRRSCPYRRMKVWEASEEHAATLFDSVKLKYDHLGHIVENRVIQLALIDQMKALDNVDLITPAKTHKIDYSPGFSIVELDDGRQLVARLLVAADGGDSRVRQAVGIGVQKWDYEQHALVASVITEDAQQDITWQQFTPTGPLAFLPLSGHRASLVWYNTPSEVKRLMRTTDEEFLAELTHRFPATLGNIESLLGRGSFPLRRQHAQQYAKEGVVLVGDAAHMIHPLAGQGVNIGLLDAAALAQTLMTALEEGEDISSMAVLSHYEKHRRRHNFIMMQAMDLFYRVFSNDLLPLKLLRNVGLGVAGKASPLKNKVMAFAMGLEGDLPEIAK